MTELRTCSLETVRGMCERFHAYKGAGGVSVYAFAVFEDGAPVATYAWQPPPPGAARSVCPEAPQGVLALSRMVAVPKDERELKHISKPLRTQMHRLIDRTRWPVLLTYSDEGLGHTGHVYKCSGWERTSRRKSPIYLDATGARASRYADGEHDPVARGLVREGSTWIQRWEHWACPRGEALAFMEAAGWRREPTGGTWRSGAKAYRWVRR